ncbi:MAG: sugar phosphate nucleotidyltransferase [Verrucomicrobiota bacterium]
MNKRFYAVILAGGRGERFWPLSTSQLPKQLLSLVGGKPLLTRAFERLKGLIPPSRVYVITNRDLVAATRRAVPAVPRQHIIGEPIGRDTAAAIAVGGALVSARDPDAAFCVLTADHMIGDLDVFRRSLRASLELGLVEDVLVTIGMKPTEPSTAYGYIESSTPMASRRGVGFRRVHRFVEKPDLEKAKRYCAAARYFWNSGMFIWSARSLETALGRHRPALARMMADLRPRAGTPSFAPALKRHYAALEKISIDYALMERANNIVMAEAEFAWDDLGSWTALENQLPQDALGNVVLGSCASLASAGNIVVSKGRLTALIGVTDMVVVQAGGVTLVCPKARAQDVKTMVERLRASGRHGGVL